MKSFKLFLIAIVSLLIVPLVVFADAGGPQIRSYSVRVSKAGGIKLTANNWTKDKKEEITIPFDTILNIEVDYEKSDGLYGEFYVELNGNNYGGEIKLSDCQLVAEEFKPDDYMSTHGKKYVYKSGAYLYKGPAKMYSKVAGNVMVPAGTVIEYTYSDGNYVYVTYNGVSGWVYSADSGAVYPEPSSLANVEDNNIYTFGTVNLIKGLNEDTQTTYTVPAKTSFSSQYRYEMCNEYYECETYYYVKYKDTEGWIKSDKNVGVSLRNAIYTRDLTVEGCTTLSTLDKCPMKIAVAKDTLLIAKYTVYDGYDEYYLTEFNGSDVYFSFDTRALVGTIEKYRAEKDIKVYDNYNGKEIDKVLEKGTVFNAYAIGSGWLYVPELEAWIQVDYQKDISYVYGEVALTDLKKDDKDKTESKTGIPSKQLITYCFIGSLILVLVVVIIIIAVNKKKPAKKPDVEKETADKKE